VVDEVVDMEYRLEPFLFDFCVCLRAKSEKLYIREREKIKTKSGGLF
jgi:hypothetical protein